MKTKQLVNELKKDYPKSISIGGSGFKEAERLRTNIFAFDLTTGGGFPKGRISVLYGPESSLKTSLAMAAISQSQVEGKATAFIDVEAAYDNEWAECLGVDNSKLIYVSPDHAEEAVDLAEQLLYADDIGVVVLDSIAALITTKEVESSADKAAVGNAGLLASKFYRKATLAMSRAKKAGRFPVLLCINQIRYKIGVMYGNPETQPGGMAFKYASSLTIRLSAADEYEPKIHGTLPAFKTCKGVIKKNKIPILGRAFEFRLNLVDNDGYGMGKVDDRATVLHYAKEYELLKKTKTGYTFRHQEFKTQKELVKLWKDEPVFMEQSKKYLVDHSRKITYEAKYGTKSVQSDQAETTKQQ